MGLNLFYLTKSNQETSELLKVNIFHGFKGQALYFYLMNKRCAVNSSCQVSRGTYPQLHISIQSNTRNICNVARKGK